MFLLIILAYTAPIIIENIKTQYTPLLELRTHIGIIHIQESLTNSYRSIAELHTFFKNPHIKGIIIKMDCLGGAAGTGQTIFHEIRHLKKEFPKPIIALIENNCLASGYLIASACDYIIAPESALIGNIGPDFITIDHIQNQPELISLHEDAYQQLIKHIAIARKLSLTTADNWAHGKIFTGHQALNFGLINEIGSLCTAIKIIKEKALIEGEIEWIEQRKKCHWSDMFSISSLLTNVQ